MKTGTGGLSLVRGPRVVVAAGESGVSGLGGVGEEAEEGARGRWEALEEALGEAFGGAAGGTAGGAVGGGWEVWGREEDGGVEGTGLIGGDGEEKDRDKEEDIDDEEVEKGEISPETVSELKIEK